MKDIKVSIIVPVYNSEEFIDQCLKSIVNQTLDDIEIICVDDGSTDNSHDILKSYSDKYDNVIILNQENKGAGAARNLGLKIAKGEYISFVDSDDWIKEDAYELVYNNLKSQELDILMFKMINFDNETKEFYETDYYNLTPLKHFENGEIFNYNDVDIFKIAVSPCNKLYKNSFLKKINAKFPEGMIFEDNVFYYNLILKAKNISFFNEFFYFRRRLNDSVMGDNDKTHFDIVPISNMIVDVFKNNGVYDKYKKNLLNKKITLIREEYKKFTKNNRKEFLNLIKEDFSYINKIEKLKNDYEENLEKINLDFFLNSIKANDYTEFDFLNLKDFCDNLNSQYESLKNSYSELKVHHNNVRKSREEITSSLNSFKKANSDLRTEKNTLSKQNRLLGRKNSKLHKENIKLNNDLNSIYSSKSWKITKILRKGNNIFKK